MGSLLGDLPSYNPHNFSQLRPSDRHPSSQSRLVTYYPTDNCTLPPPDQVITTEATNILLRRFYEMAEHKHRSKRPAGDHLKQQEPGGKQPRVAQP